MSRKIRGRIYLGEGRNPPGIFPTVHNNKQRSGSAQGMDVLVTAGPHVGPMDDPWPGPRDRRGMPPRETTPPTPSSYGEVPPRPGRHPAPAEDVPPRGSFRA
eukprot:scaffold155_cov347-Pavlova_lutheri.AAC.75